MAGKKSSSIVIFLISSLSIKIIRLWLLERMWQQRVAVNVVQSLHNLRDKKSNLQYEVEISLHQIRCGESEDEKN